MKMETSKQFWRSLDEFTGSKELEELRHREFAAGASELKDFNRRNFLKLMGASLALAGLPACTRQPFARIVPYTNQPENLVPGNPMFFATAMTLSGFATGLIVESHEGHPTKIEGNPAHPASLGATNIFHQATLLDLYDPDRSQIILRNGQPDTWENFTSATFSTLEWQKLKKGSGLRILTETISSPTLYFQIQELLKKFPEAKWHQYEPLNRDNSHEGSRLAFGEVVETQYRFDKAKVVLSLDADFLHNHPNSLRYARDFTAMRRARFPRMDMNRLYVVESTPTITGSNADHRLPKRACDIEKFAFTIARRLDIQVSGSMDENTQDSQWLTAITDDLLENRGRSIVIAGENQPPSVHALAHVINYSLGNIGHTMTFTATAEPNPVNQTDSLRELVTALDEGHVDALLILGGNPVFTAPADFQFAEKLAKASFRVHLNPDVNETSALCNWHIPQNHFLESWSDARAFDGTISVIQPLILPLYDGKSAHEILDVLILPPGRNDYDVVHDFWKSQNPDANFKNQWRQALHDGFITGSTLSSKTIKLKSLDSISFRQPVPQSDLEITFRPDHTILDGRFANNGWLQELPKPITKLTWDNAALISSTLANNEKLANGDIVEIDFQNRKLELPVWITPGQPENSIGLQVGYGRTHVGNVGSHAGFDTYSLRTSNACWFGSGATLKKTSRQYPLVTTQTQHAVDSEDRQILREGTFGEFKNNPNFVQDNSESPAASDTLFNLGEFPDKGYRWGMSIDLSACIGCNACTIACQAENNIPVVGKEQVAAGRIMHWVRVDGYFRGDPSNPAITHQPVPCMQCENAPCEVVCPVEATVHDIEGLNLQVYNRCIGTRYCSNNCPYKVRRFNFFQYADYNTPSLKPMRNPNVTVRWRGVMEKCTYCLQRISAARIHSENENRQIRDGEIQTACQQVCPAKAIVFGDLNDPQSAVSKLKSHPLNFLMLGQLNTRPRTTYLAKLRNLNPKILA
jgi:molybdopterin-containing oxidoreductase family iron-sulfur binding subunit